MKNKDLFDGATEECKKLYKEAKKALRLKQRKDFIRRLREDIAKGR